MAYSNLVVVCFTRFDASTNSKSGMADRAGSDTVYASSAIGGVIKANKTTDKRNSSEAN